jgi:Secretory lipase
MVVAGCGGTAGVTTPLSGFYATPTGLTEPPGTLLHFQPLGITVAGGHAFRILYVSDTSDGRPRASGGVLVVPGDAAPAGGRPIVAWAHPVVGANIAPSRSSTPLATMEPWLSHAIDNGWVVVATDFVGVGTHRQESLVGRAEANDIAYSVVAARHFPRVNAGGRWVAFGGSSGGHGALWSGSMAPSLIPGLQLLGVAAIAPVAELIPLERAQGKPWAPKLLAQTPVALQSSMPAFIAQGTRDDVVPAATTALLQHQRCSAGSTLYVDWLPGVTHDGAIDAASPSAISWIEGRFRGTPPPSNCEVSPPVSPTGG